jgi:hypothetical protein
MFFFEKLKLVLFLSALLPSMAWAFPVSEKRSFEPSEAGLEGCLSSDDISFESSFIKELYQQRSLSFSIFLGAQESQLKIPIVSPALNPFLPDYKKIKKDVEEFKNIIENCQECAFYPAGTQSGYSQYIAKRCVDGRDQFIQIHLYYPAPGISTAELLWRFERRLKISDVIIYAGHSRLGKGFPDFNGPAFRSGRPLQPEVNDEEALEAASSLFSPIRRQLLFLNSCNTEEYFSHFLDKISEKNQGRLGVILARDDTFFEDYPYTSMALVRGILKGSSWSQIQEQMERQAVQHRFEHDYEDVPDLFSFDRVSL